jgi:hypothetical protein
VVRILAVMAATIVILLLRSPHMATHPAFLEEETGGWWSATFVRSALETLITPWNGSVYVLPRAGFLVARLLPVPIAPLGSSIVFILTLGLVAAFIASDRLAEAIPGDYVRAVAGIGLVLLPFAGAWVYATILDAPFWLAIYLSLLLVATPPWTRAWKIADVLGAAVAAFSGPASLFLAPLYAVSIRRRPVVSIVVLGGAAAEFASLLTSVRRPVTLDPVNVTITAVGRMLTVPFGDRLGYKLFTQPAIAIVIMAAIVIAFWFASRSLPRTTVAVLAYASAAIAFMGTMGQPNSPHDLAYQTDQGRYFIVTAWTILLVGVAALVARRPAGLDQSQDATRLARGIRRLAGLFLCLSLGIGLWSTARVVPVSGPQWACVGLNAPCTAGSIVWPGDPAEFRLPIGVQAAGWIYPK